MGEVRGSSVISKLRFLGVSKELVAFVVALAVFPILVRNDYVIHMATTMLLFASLAMAFDFTAGYIGVVNFGFAAFMGLGGYTSALLVKNLGVHPIAGMLAGAGVVGIMGLALALLTLRLHGMFAAVMAWFLGLALQSVMANWVEVTRGYLGLSVPLLFPTVERTPYFYAMIGLFLITYTVLRAVVNSRIGLAFMALGDDYEAAQAAGISFFKYRVLNFTISSIFAGLIGGYYAHFIGILTPDVLSTAVTVEILVIAYVGGRGSLWGAILAAFTILPAMEFMRIMGLEALRYMIYGATLILIMIFVPEGFAGIITRIRRKLKKGRM